MVHAPILRHLERVADCDRSGSVPAGTSQGQEWPAVDPKAGEKDFDAIGNASGSGPRRAVVATDRPPTQSGQGDDPRLGALQPHKGRRRIVL
jgi:hypothetical protein